MLTIELFIIKHSHRKSFVYNYNPMKYTSITDVQKSFVCSFMLLCVYSDSKNIGISIVYSNHI